MKVMIRLAALALAFCVVCTGVCAQQTKNRLTFELSAEKSFEEPMSRWLNEMCSMATVTTWFIWDDSGKYLTAALDMGKNRAVEISLIRRSGNVYISGNLLDEPIVVNGVCDWADEMFLYAAFGLKTPSSGSVTVVSNENLAMALKSFSGRLRAVAAVARGSICRKCENCQACDDCKTCDASTAVSMFTQALAERFDKADEHNALIINCQKLTGEAVPFEIEPLAEADDGLTVELMRKAIKAVTDAIAANA